MSRLLGNKSRKIKLQGGSDWCTENGRRSFGIEFEYSGKKYYHGNTSWKYYSGGRGKAYSYARGLHRAWLESQKPVKEVLPNRKPEKKANRPRIGRR